MRGMQSAVELRAPSQTVLAQRIFVSYEHGRVFRKFRVTKEHRRLLRPLEPLILLVVVEFKNIPLIIIVTAQVPRQCASAFAYLTLQCLHQRTFQLFVRPVDLGVGQRPVRCAERQRVRHRFLSRRYRATCINIK